MKLAALAAALLLAACGGGADPTARTVPALPERVETLVYTVALDIPRGTVVDAGFAGKFLRLTRIPQERAPENAVDEIDSIRGLVAITDLAAGQVLVAGMFVPPRLGAVTVLHWTADLPSGTLLDAALLAETVVAAEIPGEFLPPDAVPPGAELAGRTLAVDVAAGQVVVEAMFAPP